MSLHYLLDGYNILKQIPAFSDLPLEEGRRGFLRWLEHARPQGSANNRVTVVFDGDPDHFGVPMQGEIQVIFSRGSADDAIKHMVQGDAQRKNCVVVSNDKDIYLYARRLGAQVMSVADFTSRNKTSRERKRASLRDGGVSAGKYIPLSRQEKINKELKGLWLKEK